MEVQANCPLCHQENALAFYEGTENGAPHGAGYWPMPVHDFNQDCDCEIPEGVLDLVQTHAWQSLQLQEYGNQLGDLERRIVELYDLEDDKLPDEFRAFARIFSPRLEYEYSKDKEPAF